MNLRIYEKVRVVPDAAQKQIAGGRLKGMTDINPMWRIKTLTETFGPCGFGWKYVITGQRIEIGANGESAAFVDINLYIKDDNEWSEPIPGTGGSMFVANERNGMYTSDECFKMALTDALSVACKALGFGADVYWQKDRSKYDAPNEKLRNIMDHTCEQCNSVILPRTDKDGNRVAIDELVARSKEKFGKVLCVKCAKEQAAEHATA